VDNSNKEEVRELPIAEAQKHPRKLHCLDCGSILQNMTATFSFGDHESWTLPLPVCVKCDPSQFKGQFNGWRLQSGTT
jgi:hypothetical protein